MSVKDILLDRVKDKLYHDLHGSLWERVGDRLNNVHRPLEKWDVEYVTDFIDLIIENEENNIDKIINKNITEKDLILGNLKDSTINDIVEEIKSSKLVLTGKPTTVWKPDATNKTTFPFSARSLLQMCWGLTLNFSHNTQQQAVGAMFNVKFNDQHNLILTPNLAKNLNDPNSTFLMNLEMAFSSALRNLGFIRDNHTEYLLFNGDRLAERRQNLENMADFASFSGSGLFAKLGSFIGVGSLTDFLSETHLSLIWLPYFALGGIIGAFAVTILVRVYVSQTDDTWDRQTEKDQNRYWKEHYKKDVTNELYNLYLSIIGLIEKFYPDKKNEIIQNDELLKSYKQAEYVKSVIREQIVAPDDLLWFPLIQTPQTNAQTASSQTQTSDSQSANKSADTGKSSTDNSTTKSKSS